MENNKNKAAKVKPVKDDVDGDYFVIAESDAMENKCGYEIKHYTSIKKAKASALERTKIDVNFLILKVVGKTSAKTTIVVEDV